MPIWNQITSWMNFCHHAWCQWYGKNNGYRERRREIKNDGGGREGPMKLFVIKINTASTCCMSLICNTAMPVARSGLSNVRSHPPCCHCGWILYSFGHWANPIVLKFGFSILMIGVLKIWEPSSGSRLLCQLTLDRRETLGMCTTLISALDLPLSQLRNNYRFYNAVAN